MSSIKMRWRRLCTPVLAALEQLAAQQAAIEWLREADLFRLILV